MKQFLQSTFWTASRPHPPIPQNKGRASSHPMTRKLLFPGPGLLKGQPVGHGHHSRHPTGPALASKADV